MGCDGLSSQRRVHPLAIHGLFQHVPQPRGGASFQSLVDLNLAVDEPIPVICRENRTRACRITHKGIYRELGVSNIRHRRFADPGAYLRRLLSSDYVLDHAELEWLPTEEEKVWYCADPLHGHQEGRFFHGYYGNYCYLPALHLFGRASAMRPGCGAPMSTVRTGAVEELNRIIGQIRQSWPEVSIIIRADSGFCRDELLSWCEAHQVDYVVGLAKNDRLKREIAESMSQAEAEFNDTGKPARVFNDFRYRTRKSWTCERRVIGKAEFLEKGANPRFVVTSLSPERLDARALYEDFYCARGDMENRIKEQQLDLFADRTSAATMRANQLRLYLSSAAYMLIHALRRLGLKNTDLARAQCQTIRLKLLKIGAQVRLTVRNIWISMSEAYPYAEGLCPRPSKAAGASSALLRTDPIPCAKIDSPFSAPPRFVLSAFRHPLLNPKTQQLPLVDTAESRHTCPIRTQTLPNPILTAQIPLITGLVKHAG